MPSSDTFWLSVAVASIGVVPVCIWYAVLQSRKGDRDPRRFATHLLLVPAGMAVAALVILLHPILDLLGLAVHLVDFGAWIKDKLLGD